MMTKDWVYCGPLFKGYCGVTQGEPLYPHDIQFGSGCRHLTLGDGDGGSGGGHGGTHRVCTGPCGIFICVRRNSRIYPAKEAAEVVWFPHRPLCPGQSPDKRKEYSENGLMALIYTWQHVGFYVWETDGGGRTNIPGASEVVDVLAGMRSGDSRGVAAGAP